MLQARKDVDHWKAKYVDLSSILHNPAVPLRFGRRCQIAQDHGLQGALDHELIRQSQAALEHGLPVAVALPIRNVHRAVGAMLSGEVVRRHGSGGLPDDTITVTCTGSAGQSFGAFLAKGITLVLEGDANDYVGKGLSGGKLVVFPPRNSIYSPEEGTVVGNVVLYGATGGEAYLSGKAGERFAVRNSGARAVVESVGDHGCEYMTNGIVAVLGKTGKNFAAGMSGGLAYVLDERGEFASSLCNRDMVDLEPLDAEDQEMLSHLIRTHVALTGSPRGTAILSRQEEFFSRFVKVFPHDFKRVLVSAAAAQQHSSGIAQEVHNG